MRTLTVKLPDSLHARLEAEAKRNGGTRSDLVRKAIEQYLARQKRPPAGSFLALAGDLIGCLEGAPDLATNPEYMKDYGK